MSLLPKTALGPIRRFMNHSQEFEAKKLKTLYGLWRTQPEISCLELGGHDPRLHEALSHYLRSCGFDGDRSGAIIYIPPHKR